jgi:hypothetical protein
MNAKKVPDELHVVLRLGFGVFPCRERRISEALKEKAPLTSRGKNDASKDPEQIAEWSRQHPDCAWGARPPPDITVLDLDTKSGVNGFNTLRQLEAQHGSLPQTLTNCTPSGGQHRVFLTDGGKYKNRAGVLPGLDVRTMDGYIIVPPSKVAVPPSTQAVPYR